MLDTAAHSHMCRHTNTRTDTIRDGVQSNMQCNVIKRGKWRYAAERKASNREPWEYFSLSLYITHTDVIFSKATVLLFVFLLYQEIEANKANKYY